MILRQETVTSDGRIKRWRHRSADGAFYQVRLSLDGNASELAGTARVVYQVTGPSGVMEVPSTRAHRRFATALWVQPPASITAVVEAPGDPDRLLEAELALDLPVDEGTNYMDVDLRFCF